MNVDQLNDDELAATVYVWHVRAKHGDEEAAGIARHLDDVLKARLGNTPSSHAPLEGETDRKPCWRLWH